jgi:hypothetical protein
MHIMYVYITYMAATCFGVQNKHLQGARNAELYGDSTYAA